MKKLIVFLILIGGICINSSAQLLAPKGIKYGTGLTLLTPTATEFNILHGVTSSALELNVLDGVLASYTEINYLVGVSSAIQTQLNTKASSISPTFTGIIKVGTTDTLATQAYARSEGGGGSTIDTTSLSNRINLKANIASPTFTGTVGGITATMVGLGNVTNESKVTMFTSPTFTGTVSGISPSMVGLGNVTNESKATMFSSPTFTGTAVLPTTTSIGTVSATEIGYINGVTSAVQTQFTGKVGTVDTATMLSKYARKASPTFTGTVGGITATMVGLGNVTNKAQVEVEDSAAMLAPYITTSETRGIIADSLSGNSIQLDDLAVMLLPDTIQVTTPTYTVLVTDANKELSFTDDFCLITLPSNATAAIPVGTTINCVSYGGVMKFAAGDGAVMVSPADSVTTKRAYDVVGLKKMATNKWRIYGALTD